VVAVEEEVVVAAAVVIRNAYLALSLIVVTNEQFSFAM